MKSYRKVSFKPIFNVIEEKCAKRDFSTSLNFALITIFHLLKMILLHGGDINLLKEQIGTHKKKICNMSLMTYDARMRQTKD